jgi:hypothetical protein
MTLKGVCDSFLFHPPRTYKLRFVSSENALENVNAKRIRGIDLIK